MSLENLKTAMEVLDAQAAASLPEPESTEEITLTDDEKARLEEMKTERSIVVNDTNTVTNTSMSIPLSEYAKSLDEKTVALRAGETLKLINSGEITQTAESMTHEVRERALKAFRELAVSGDDISDDDYLSINDKALAAVQAHFKMDRLDTDMVIKKLSKLTLAQICEILPDEFVDLYTSKREREVNNVKAKERLLASIGYLTVTGPELDYLNNYIDEENKLALVSQRLLQCQVDFAEMLKNDQSMAEIIQESLDICPLDTSFWAKHIKMPNRVHNEFAQRVVMQEHYLEAYKKLLDDYPVSDDPATESVNARARDLINAEIDEANHKIEVYRDVTNLELLKSLWPNIVDRFGPNAVKKKKPTVKYLVQEAVAAIDRVRRCKQNLPFPGYNGAKRAEDIFTSFVADYTKMIASYNTTVKIVDEAESDQNLEDYLIQVSGYPDNVVAMVFTIAISLAMGRITKALTKHDATKYDAIQLDAYFQLFCRMGTDVYMMADVWAIVRDFVKYILDTYYKPDQKVKTPKKDVTRVKVPKKKR